MSNILIQSIAEKNEIKTLLAKKMPSYRKAYSDRTSWLMACISELAYIKFNPLIKDSAKERVIKQVSELINAKDKKALSTLIDQFGYDATEEKKKLEENVTFLNLRLIETFDQNDTQAILLEDDNYLFLGFRGTEPTSVKDIKSDLKANTKTCVTGGKVHSGFDEAFGQTAVAIQAFLDQAEYIDKPLFITGHSLGGALATIAAKKLTHKGGIAACYTFGSPRVGNVEWATGIKVPIYRVVNAVDPVTMIPPGTVSVESISWVFGFIPYVGTTIKKLLISKFGGYYHCGNMRYLSICKSGDYNNVQLLYSVSFIFRVRAFLISKISGIKIPADHSISVYRNKLKVIASQRNKDS